jgi:activator of 2-hydroxyglutaryl-CoA dehydratase
MASGNYYLGIDLGSVSLNMAVIDSGAQIKASTYRRTEGRPLAVLMSCLEEWSKAGG